MTPTKPRTADRHRPRKQIALEPDLYAALVRYADDNERPVRRQLRLIVLNALREAGYLPNQEPGPCSPSHAPNAAPDSTSAKPR